MSNLAILGLCCALVLGCLIGHLGWLMVHSCLDNYGGPIMGIAGVLALVLGVAVVEGCESKRSDYERP